MSLTETRWNPVSIGTKVEESYNPTTITSHVMSTSWFNKVINNDGTRYQKLKNFYSADTCSVEISRALDIIAEDISSANAADSDNSHFYIDFGEDSKIKKTTMDVINGAKTVWEERTRMNDEFFDRVRKTLRYGATFYKKNNDGSLSELPSERFVGYILSEQDEKVVTHYLYDPSIETLDRTGRIFQATKTNNAFTVTNRSKSEQYETISVNDLVIFKLGDKPFGESLIDRVYGVWKTMKLLEDSIVVYRVTRSTERRVFYIDVGNLQGPKREQAIERMRIKMNQRKAAKGGELITEYDPQSLGEDLFIPTSANGKGSRVEMLQGGSNLGELTDIDWFSKKLAAGLRIPQSMLDTTENNQSQYSDMRVGQMYAIEMRYLGMINRYRQRFILPLREHFVEFCKRREIVIISGVKLKIQESHSFAKYKQMELNQTSLNIFNSTLQITQLSKKLALQQYLNFDAEMLARNEEMKLLEKGIPMDQIKSMSLQVRDNLVYGDGHLGSEYGIEPQQGQSW
jgi:hypothetical protein